MDRDNSKDPSYPLSNQPSYSGHQQTVMIAEELDAPPSYEEASKPPSRAGNSNASVTSTTGVGVDTPPPSSTAGPTIANPASTRSSVSTEAGEDIPLHTSTSAQVETQAYSSQKPMTFYSMDDETKKTLLDAPGCCFSDTGGCFFSSMGGCCFSANQGCFFSDTGGCCFSANHGCFGSDHGGCCFSDGGACFCSGKN